jgi:hypothetical protein
MKARRSRVELQTAIFESGLMKVAICSRSGLHPWRLSRIIHGVADPTDDEKRALAKVLRVSVKSLFPARPDVDVDIPA